MIPYFGLPITPNTAGLAAIGGGHAFVSFNRPDQLGLAIDFAQSFAIDNGAFSRWKQEGAAATDWSAYYAFVADLLRIPSFDFAVIPDVIGGTEAENDALLEQWPHPDFLSAPVWHLDESLERLARLVARYPRICLGSAGAYANIGDRQWWARMNAVMDAICCDRGRPPCKLHGLRMLHPEVVARLPFASADSSHIGRSIGIDSKWTGGYAPSSKDVRAAVLRRRIETVATPDHWVSQPVQENLFHL